MDIVKDDEVRLNKTVDSWSPGTRLIVEGTYTRPDGKWITCIFRDPTIQEKLVVRPEYLTKVRRRGV